MATVTSLNFLFQGNIRRLDAAVDGFEEGIARIGDKLVDALINIGADNAWQAQSLARQIVFIQSQLRGQLNQLGYQDLADRFVSAYDESELFGRTILQELGKMSGQLIPMRSDTLSNLKAFDLSAFDEFGNGMIRILSREMVFNTVAGKKRSDVIQTLSDAMDGQVAQATTLADTSLRSFDRFVNGQTFESAGITRFKYFGPSDNRNRPFCAAHVNRVYDLSAIKQMNNGSVRYGNVWSFGGGSRCRHVWVGIPDAHTDE